MAKKEKKKKRKPDTRPQKKSSASSSTPPLLNNLVLGIAVFLFAFLIYANSINNQFVWDDDDLIVDNPNIGKLDGETVKSIFGENFWESKNRLGSYYRPLVTLSFHVNHAIFGMSPAGFHAVNVIVNALVCVLLFLFLQMLFGNRLLALIAALIFAALPLHTENVAWISGRTDIFATFWMLVAALLFLSAHRRRRWGILAASLAAFMLALLAKEIAILLPLLLLIVAIIDNRSTVRSDGRSAVPPQKRMGSGLPFTALLLHLLPVAVYLLLRNHVIGTSTTTYAHMASTAAGKLLLPFSIIAGYAVKLIYPFRLSGEYDAPVPSGPADINVIGGVLVTALFIFALWRFRKNGAILLGLSFLALGTAPVLNILPLGEISADRFLYLPSIGFALIVGSLFAALLARHSGIARQFRCPAPAASLPKPLAGNPFIFILLLIAILAAYSVRTVVRNRDWRNEEVLYTRTVAETPTSARAHMNLGNVHMRNNRFDQAILSYNRALAINPQYVEALSNLAGIYLIQGKLTEATPLLERAVKSAPDNVEIRSNLGMLYVQKEQYTDARRVLEQLVSIAPEHIRAWYNLGLALFALEDLKQALECFEKVKSMERGFGQSDYYIGLLSIRLGNKPYAKEHLERYIQTHQSNVGFRRNAEILLRQVNQAAEDTEKETSPQREEP